jgi:hypothetical protein
MSQQIPEPVFRVVIVGHLGHPLFDQVLIVVGLE